MECHGGFTEEQAQRPFEGPMVIELMFQSWTRDMVQSDVKNKLKRTYLKLLELFWGNNSEGKRSFQRFHKKENDLWFIATLRVDISSKNQKSTIIIMESKAATAKMAVVFLGLHNLQRY
jgi:hypothetical protein